MVYVKSFHEKADRSQDGFVFLSVDPNLSPSRLCRHPSIRSL
jgi:hypothetical protein